MVKNDLKKNNHKCMPNYACKKHHLHWLGAHYLNKSFMWNFIIFPSRFFKVEKVQNKTRSIQWTPGSQVYLNIKKNCLVKNDFWAKKMSMTNYACHKHHSHWFAAHYLTKGFCEISVSSLKDFLNKGRKSEKNA